MYLSKDKTFACMVSVEGYPDKETVQSAMSRKTLKNNQHQIGFKKEDLTVDSFINKAVNGYSFIPGILNPVCYGEGLNVRTQNSIGKFIPVYYKNGLYKGSFTGRIRTNRNIQSSQIIAIDIDETDYKCIEDIVDKLEFKPTCAYYTFSDRYDKRKIRMFYVFNKPFDYIDQFKPEEDNLKTVRTYAEVVDIIYFMFEFNTGIELDKCAKKPEQIMHGTNKKDYWISYNIYEYSDFINVISTHKINPEINSLFNPNSIIVWDNDISKDADKILYGGRDGFNSIKEIYDKYRNSKYKIYHRKETDNWIECEKYSGVYWQFTDDDYFRLRTLPNKIPAHKGLRRGWLMNRIAIRKLYRNDANEILLNTALDLSLNIDNSDKKYNVSNLKVMIQSICSKPDSHTIEKLTKSGFFDEKKSRIIVHWLPKSFYKDNDTTYRSIVNTCVKESKIYIFKQLYRPDLSDKQNLDLINDSGELKLSLRTLLRYKKEIGLTDKDNRDKLVIDMLNQGLKYKEIISKLQTEFDIRITRNTITNIKNRIKS